MKAWLLLVIVLPGCLPSVDGYTFYCDGDDDCGEGWVCVKNQCANASDYPACDDGRNRCNGDCCASDQQCVTSVVSGKHFDRCCVPGGKGVLCLNGEDLWRFDSCGNPEEMVEDCGADGCSLQTHQCLTCEPTCLLQDGVTLKECGVDSCDDPTCGDCGGVPANGVCADFKCDCNANERCQGADGRVVCCAPGQVCSGGACQ